MQFTNKVSWTVPDFITIGIMLMSTSFICVFAIRKVTKRSLRIAACIFIVFEFILVWAELAVGIFGTPSAGSLNIKNDRLNFPRSVESVRIYQCFLSEVSLTCLSDFVYSLHANYELFQ